MLKMLKFAFKEETLRKTEMMLSDNKAGHSGCPPISKAGENVVQIKKLVHEYRRV
jgi:hypothetical protein